MKINYYPNGSEPSRFRRGCQLQTRVLSIVQEIQNNLAANAPTLGIHIDYRKAYDMVWHMRLRVKPSRTQMPSEFLKKIRSWLENRKARMNFWKL